MAIDRIDWHIGGDFPEHLSDEAGGTHIGLYLTWIIENDLYSTELESESKAEIIAVKNREIDGRQFLIEQCDTKFWTRDLSEIGNRFTEHYYHDAYIEDYGNLLGTKFDTLYEVENTWENYDILAKTIDRRYANWRTSDEKKTIEKGKKFWEFWK